jgi:hypothetical protein
MKENRKLNNLILAILIAFAIPVISSAPFNTCSANPIVAETTEKGIIDTIVSFMIDFVKDKEDKIEEKAKDLLKN